MERPVSSGLWKAKAIIALFAAIGIGGGVMSQVYRVVAVLLEEQGFRTTWTLLGKPVNAAATLVMGALVVAGVLVALFSRRHEDKDELELRKAIARHEQKRGVSRPGW